jgi:hypothetical protein
MALLRSKKSEHEVEGLQIFSFQWNPSSLMLSRLVMFKKSKQAVADCISRFVSLSLISAIHKELIKNDFVNN